MRSRAEPSSLKRGRYTAVVVTQGTWNNQGGDDVEMEDEMEDDGKAMAMMMEEGGGDKGEVEAKSEGVFAKEALASGSISEALRIMREKGLKGSKQDSVAGRQKDASKGGGYDEDAQEHWADKEFAKKFAGKEGTKKEIVIQVGVPWARNATESRDMNPKHCRPRGRCPRPETRYDLK